MRHTIKYGPKILTALWMILFLPSADLRGQSFELEPHQQLARDILQEIIEINTVDSAGTTKAAKALERRLLEAGFSDEDVRVVGPTQKKMNLVARLRGRDTGRPAILLPVSYTHLTLPTILRV